MEAILSKLIDQLNSSVFVLLVILFAAVAGMYYLGYYLGKWRERFFTNDQRLDKIETKVELIHETVIKLDTKVQLIYDNTNPRAMFKTSSPIALTNLGKDVASSINAETILKRYLAALVEKVDIKCPLRSNAYDIQAACMDSAKNDLPAMATSDEINQVKNEAFNRGILTEDIWGIFGIYLRDHILKERGIAVAEVDKHNPGK